MVGFGHSGTAAPVGSSVGSAEWAKEAARSKVRIKAFRWCLVFMALLQTEIVSEIFDADCKVIFSLDRPKLKVRFPGW
jgi:hypothetical protein